MADDPDSFMFCEEENNLIISNLALDVYRSPRPAPKWTEYGPYIYSPD